VDYISCSNRHNPPSPHRRKKKEILEGFTLRIGNNLSIHWPPLLLFYFEKKKKPFGNLVLLQTHTFSPHTGIQTKNRNNSSNQLQKRNEKHGEEEEKK
jgi:hypothetical protein